jgi:thymidylate kinase
MKAATRARAELIAVDGVDASAVAAAAKEALASPSRGGISKWDASGVFQDLAAAEREAGAPSARTLLLLYAADLAFRLRWQIRPALAEGRTVVAAPYVATAIAFGRAAGLPNTWLANLFGFAPRPNAHVLVHAAREGRARDGFIAFACDRVAGGEHAGLRRKLSEGTAAYLRLSDRRKSSVQSRIKN